MKEIMVLLYCTKPQKSNKPSSRIEMCLYVKCTGQILNNSFLVNILKYNNQQINLTNVTKII